MELKWAFISAVAAPLIMTNVDSLSLLSNAAQRPGNALMTHSCCSKTRPTSGGCTPPSGVLLADREDQVKRGDLVYVVLCLICCFYGAGSWFLINSRLQRKLRVSE